LISGSTFSPSR